MKQLVIGMAVVLVVVLGAYLLVKPTNAPQTTPTVEVTPEAENVTEIPQATEAASPTPEVAVEEKIATETPTPEAEGISVTLANLKFVPSNLTIKAGKNYKLTIVSNGPHTYTIDKLGINFSVAAGQTKAFDLKVDKKGTYEVYCATPGHKEGGMVGKLIVN